jgi:hypothetical protein
MTLSIHAERTRTIDYRPPLDGTTITAILRAAKIAGGSVYAILRVHPPLAEQQGRRVKYAHSLEIRESPWDAGRPLLFVTSEYDERARGRDYFLGVFDEFAHSNLGSSPDWGNLRAFATKALDVARTECELDFDLLSPVKHLQLASGARQPVDALLGEQSADLLLTLV